MNSDFPLALIQKSFFAWVKVEMKTISNKDKNFFGTYILQTYWLLEMICHLWMELKSMHTIWIVKWRLRTIGKFETLSYLKLKENISKSEIYTFNFNHQRGTKFIIIHSLPFLNPRNLTLRPKKPFFDEGGLKAADSYPRLPAFNQNTLISKSSASFSLFWDYVLHLMKWLAQAESTSYVRRLQFFWIIS